MRFLVLGGTSFVGRHFVDAAIEGGHDVTLFNRGKTNAELFPSVERRTGDREASDLDSLKEGEWDAVVDVNGYVPRHVRESAELLHGRAGSYCFISTGSVYADHSLASIGEDAKVHDEVDASVEEVTNDSYGPLKVACERTTRDVYGDRALVVRPGIVAGPHDPTGRFTYWVRRLARGGKVLAPARHDQPVQVVHARDQGNFILELLTTATHGTFNSVGPDVPVTFADLLDACARAAGVEYEAAWVSDDFAREHKVMLPLALPQSGTMGGIFRISNERGRKAGLVNRDLVDTAADTLAWQGKPADGAFGTIEPEMFPSPQREAELLALLDA